MKLSRSNLILNTLAIALTFLPVIALVWWGFQVFQPDPRQTVPLDAIARADTPQLFGEPLVSVTFDDGWESIYTAAAPLMSQYQIVSTQYIVPAEFNSPAYMSVAQLKSLKTAGHEISSHTYSHARLAGLSDKQVSRELDTSLKLLRKFDLTDSDRLTFAPPNGAVDSQSMAQIRERFYASRNVRGDISNGIGGNDINVATSYNRYDIIGYTVGQYTDNDDLQAALDYTREHNGWLVLVYHQVDESGEEYSVTPEVFEQQLQLIHDTEIKTATMRDILVNSREAQL